MASQIPQAMLGSVGSEIAPGSPLGRWMRAFARKASTGVVANANLLTPLAQGINSQVPLSSPLGQTILRVSQLYDNDEQAQLKVEGRNGCKAHF